MPQPEGWGGAPYSSRLAAPPVVPCAVLPRSSALYSAGAAPLVTRSEPFVVNIGPQHPSTHGVFRLRLTLDGEKIIDADMVMGYLHRSMEKLAEERTYTQNIPFTDRTDYVAAMTGNLAYVLAVEK